jgi:hypothetical protein
MLPTPFSSPTHRQPIATTLGQTLFDGNKVKGNKGHTVYWKLEQTQSKSLFSATPSRVSIKEDKTSALKRINEKAFGTVTLAA